MASGERIVFRKRASDTNGEPLEMDFFVAPNGFLAAPHVHPEQTETFRVVNGRFRVRIGVDERTCGPGEVAEAPPNTTHAWCNPFDDEAQLVLEVRPALGTETFLETFSGLGRDGKVNAKGRPNTLQMMVLAREYRREVALPPPIGWIVAPIAVVLAPIGRLLGYRARYPKYSRLA